MRLKFHLQHYLSRFLGFLANLRNMPLFKNLAIRYYIYHYGIDMREAEQEDIKQFPTFNAFFTRALKPAARQLATNPKAIISPVDGAISELGTIQKQQLVQAKGKYYSIVELLGEDQKLAEKFKQGHFLTAYLAPKNYHRIHMPLTGRLQRMIHIPGCLFPVHTQSVATVDNLFALNERAVCLFSTSVGIVAVILVGALIVGSISTVWHGTITPPHGKIITSWDYNDQNITLQQGEEMGRFNLGSTVILLFPEKSICFLDSLKPHTCLKMGQWLASVT